MREDTFDKLEKAISKLQELGMGEDETAGVQLTQDELFELMQDHLKLSTISLIVDDYDGYLIAKCGNKELK